MEEAQGEGKHLPIDSRVLRVHSRRPLSLLLFPHVRTSGSPKSSGETEWPPVSIPRASPEETWEVLRCCERPGTCKIPAAPTGQCVSTQNNAATSADHSQLGLQSLMLRKKTNSGRNYNCYSFLTTSISYTRKYQEFSLGHSTEKFRSIQLH